ncbi:bifunctional 5,10-methylenetetrahydrofolate dehydrogenase/5,10-methenyltetrahydrofolate cyclohydrolase [Alkalibacillus haloalkaliphilus]|uniref:bifunctional 5,10-methylenetetrahydrofolate dehydrogenase/5,10-methenyltetrahydrofolate cyclohydrolase n=1 Tax=Alkalibacillus haloalkaliphilus TaxID=94136 RepID=UPI0029366B4A|nr:tetrahydrofolate dehydrogenase/cyclohydrolase catalytic domain-containing protein [Alkalibacillus haloalkaliphilus]MDV2580947.1 tetrahydrofolate dehydrogenase/cyclohydrolase catalytic domain-containing protein [Alkalibacillus haloalkaliphilus]
MSTTIMYGNTVADYIRSNLTEDIRSLKEQGVIPKLTVIIIGDNPASKTYVRIKKKAAEKIGITSDVIELPVNTSEQQLLNHIETLNEDSSTHGILIQLPLPDHINEKRVLDAVSPEKDADGFHPINVGRLSIGQEAFYPCTPYGIMKLLDYYQVPVAKKHVVVVGRSNIVGKPIGQMLLNEDATVTYCHSKTDNLNEYTKQADILIVAVGKAEIIKKKDVKKGAVVVDVGNTFLETGKVVGDVAFDEMIDHVSFITPVPKGVGPMTITMLLSNTIQAAKRLS